MSELKQVSISFIDPNPFRLMDHYPWIEPKLNQLQRSIEDVGLWEGIIVRQLGKRYQMAFGHHRLEAARRAGVKKASVIVRRLTDEEMLRFMGRENGEDYGTEFLVMLNTWEGAMEFRRHAAQKIQPLEIAALLGWVRKSTSKKGIRMSDVAVACAAAYSLIEGGYLEADELGGLAVKAAKEIVTAAQSRMQRIESMAEKTQRPKREVEKAKKHIATGAKRTAEKVREGVVSQRDLRSTVDVETYKSAKTERGKPTPLFAMFATRLADQMDKMLSEDATAGKLSQIAETMKNPNVLIDQYEDAQVLRRIDWSLENLSSRADHWREKLKPKRRENVVSIDKLLKDREA